MPRYKQTAANQKPQPVQAKTNNAKQTKQHSQNIKKSSQQRPVPVSSTQKKTSNLPFKKNGKTVYQDVSLNYSTEQKSVVQQNCTFETGGLKLALASLISYLANKGVISNTETTGLDAPWEAVYGGSDHILAGICSEIQGGTAKLSSYPRVIGDLLAALKPKTVPFQTYGNMAYAWTPFDGTLSVDGVNSDWAPTYIAKDAFQDGPISPAEIYTGSTTPNEDLYSGLLRVLTGSKLHKALEIVEADGKHSYESPLAKDASAFARVYTYNGYQPSPTSGFWKDVESEVTITAPVYSNYCKYDVPDKRSAMKLTPWSGGPEMSLAGRIIFDRLSPFNKTPYVFKEIDFEEIYTMLTMWMCLGKEMLIRSAVGNFDGAANESLPFTAQEFRIMLRQALVSIFPSQVVGQFNSVVGGLSTNDFRPFCVMGNCHASTKFEEMLIPSMLAENLGALQPRSLRYKGKNASKQSTVYIPVLGRRRQDTPIIPQFIVGGKPVPLFITKSDETFVDLTNGAYGATGQFANLNATFYEVVCDDWNYHVSQMSEVFGSVQAIRNDPGPLGMGILYMTRVVKTFVTEGKSGAAPKAPIRYVESLRNVKNNGIPKTEEKPILTKMSSVGTLASKTGGGFFPPVGEVPPGSIVRNGCTTVTCNRRLLAEEEGLYDFLILPSVRTSDTEDAITVQMYQTEVREALSTFNANSVTTTGADMYSKMQLYASLCVPGLARKDSNIYTRVFAHLQDMNQGGMLSGLLAGVIGNAFPSAKGIVDSINGAVGGFLP